MNDFETVREACDIATQKWAITEYKPAPYRDALDRIEAEVERLREDANAQYAAWEQATEMLGEATMEVERLREHSQDFQAAWAQAKKDLTSANREVERLREWKVSAEVAHEQNQGLVAEVERLQRLVAAYEDIELVKEVERLRAALERIAALDAETATDCWYIARNALAEEKELRNVELFEVGPITDPLSTEEKE